MKEVNTGDIMQRAAEWIVGSHTGTSSKTIWAALVGAVKEPQQCNAAGRFSTPSDPDDFSRCHRLLELIPEWRPRLPEVAVIFPKWGPLVREWERLTTLFIEEGKSGRCPKLYAEMQKLEAEAMRADGWEQTSHGSWRRGESRSVSLGQVTISS